MYDVIIVGSGPAGISASLYTQRANLKTLILTKGMGTLAKVYQIDNYYGFENGITGEELQRQGELQAKRLGVLFQEEEVVKIDQQEDGSFLVKTIVSQYEAKAVILGTGTSRKVPPIKGVKELEGRGVSYCATCDAFFFRGKEVAVLGSGDYAFHEAEELKPIVKSVTLLTNGEKLVENRSTQWEDFEIEERPIREFRGENRIEQVEFVDNTKRNIDGIFVAIGTASSSDLARKIGVAISKNNTIIVNKETMETSVKGLYACGDCTEGGLLQVSKAVYEGSVAGMSVIKQIRQKGL